MKLCVFVWLAWTWLCFTTNNTCRTMADGNRRLSTVIASGHIPLHRELRRPRSLGRSLIANASLKCIFQNNFVLHPHSLRVSSARNYENPLSLTPHKFNATAKLLRKSFVTRRIHFKQFESSILYLNVNECEITLPQARTNATVWHGCGVARVANGRRRRLRHGTGPRVSGARMRESASAQYPSRK